MLIDQKIIKWLESNNPRNREEVYEQFPEVEQEVIDFHINKIHPDAITSLIPRSTPIFFSSFFLGLIFS